jgi:hypothetical protein
MGLLLDVVVRRIGNGTLGRTAVLVDDLGVDSHHRIVDCLNVQSCIINRVQHTVVAARLEPA